MLKTSNQHGIVQTQSCVYNNSREWDACISHLQIEQKHTLQLKTP
jgi:hypothetical protein